MVNCKFNYYTQVLFVVYSNIIMTYFLLSLTLVIKTTPKQRLSLYVISDLSKSDIIWLPHPPCL